MKRARPATAAPPRTIPRSPHHKDARRRRGRHRARHGRLRPRPQRDEDSRRFTQGVPPTKPLLTPLSPTSLGTIAERRSPCWGELNRIFRGETQRFGVCINAPARRPPAPSPVRYGGFRLPLRSASWRSMNAMCRRIRASDLSKSLSRSSALLVSKPLESRYSIISRCLERNSSARVT